MFGTIERNCYFVRKILSGNDQNSKNVKEEILRDLNNDPARTKGHSAHRLVYDKDGRLVGFKCNCGKGDFHLIDANGSPLWTIKISKKEMNAIIRREVLIEVVAGMTFEL